MGATGSVESRGLLLGSVGVVIALIAGVLIVTSLGTSQQQATTSAAGEVFLQAAQAPGIDPFLAATADLIDMEPIFLARVTVSAPAGAESGDAEPITAKEIPGTELGLYGGTKDNSRCNSELIIDFLEANTDKAAAWADAQGIEPNQIRPFIESLTAGVLLRDTRVTNHGFRDGRANPFQAVLQAGTAVLLDSTGIPRVRCACGNPLNKPVPQTQVVTYSGPQWDGFDPNTLLVVAPAASSTDQFVLQNLDGGEPFVRPRGTKGETDEPAPQQVIDAIRTDLIIPGLGDTIIKPIGGTPTTGDETAPTTTTAPTPTTAPAAPAPTPPPTTAPPPPTPELQVLQSRDFCTAWSGYEAIANSGQFDNATEGEGIAFIDAAFSDLAAIAPPEIAEDMQFVSDAWPDGSIDDPAWIAAGDRVTIYLEEVCGIAQ